VESFLTAVGREENLVGLRLDTGDPVALCLSVQGSCRFESDRPIKGEVLWHREPRVVLS
jgi:hypothetical protein